MASFRPKVLYIDDDIDACTVMVTLLEMHSIDVKTVNEGVAALDRVQGEEFDMYLVDSRLPGMDGYDLCRKVRALYPLKPIVFYTGSAHAGQREKAMDAGANEFIVKPDFDTLVSSIGRLVPANAHI